MDTNFKFINPGILKIEDRTSEDGFQIVNMENSVWQWNNLGRLYSFNTNNIKGSEIYINQFKSFVVFGLKHYSETTVASNFMNLNNILFKHGFTNNYPWSLDDFVFILEVFKKNFKGSFWFLKSFVKFSINNQVFDQESFQNIIEDSFIGGRDPYRKVFQQDFKLNQLSVNRKINNLYNKVNTYSLQEQVLIKIIIELAPRLSQIYSLSCQDLKVINSSPHDFYYILLPMARKKSQPEKRWRKITKETGELILKLKDLLLNKNKNINNPPLFCDDKGNRFSTVKLNVLIDSLLSNQFSNDERFNLTTYRHIYAQSLADQGASADIIAEMMGHNSTVPARAYIQATPSIAEIKSKALGLSQVYEEISRAVLTGEIVNKHNMLRINDVKGLVNGQYIGDIGSCGLDVESLCPSNPIYSCYSCLKFHPFKEGKHESVRDKLKQQVQLFIDSASKMNDLKHNRPVIQLENTIIEIEKVIKRIKDSDND